MIDPITLRRWLYRLLLLAIAALLTFFHLLPLGGTPGGWPGPDLMIAIIFAWTMRRPEYTPALLVGLVMLIDDMLFMRPPGLWAALAVIGCEFLRGRTQLAREMPFLVEWLLVAAVMAAMVLVNRLVLAIFVVDQVGLGLTLLQLMITIITYPLVALLSAHGLGVRKVAPGEMDQPRYRI